MTRSELIDAFATRFPKVAVSKNADVVKTIVETMVTALAHGQRVEIRSFGSFSLSQRAPRVGRNPKTGERVQVPAKWVAHFKPGKELREQVNRAARSGSDCEVR